MKILTNEFLHWKEWRTNILTTHKSKNKKNWIHIYTRTRTRIRTEMARSQRTLVAMPLLWVRWGLEGFWVKWCGGLTQLFCGSSNCYVRSEQSQEAVRWWGLKQAAVVGVREVRFRINFRGWATQICWWFGGRSNRNVKDNSKVCDLSIKGWGCCLLGRGGCKSSLEYLRI